jgi:uncharacterized protein (TIGR03435 family)
LRFAILPAVFCGCLLAQGNGPALDAASIKLSPPLDSTRGPIYVGAKGGPGTDDPVRYSCTFCAVDDLVSEAYNVPDFRVSSASRLPGERFHLLATLPAETTREQFRLMLQNLLAERFKLAVHHESRDMQAFHLVVASGGPNLKAHVEGGPLPPPPDPKKPSAPGVYYRVQGKTLADFAQLVEGQLRRPVIDATGLSGKYDFDVWWTMDDLSADAPAPPDAPTLRSAIQSLGLRLESQKGPVDVVVIDHVEKLPAAN